MNYIQQNYIIRLMKIFRKEFCNYWNILIHRTIISISGTIKTQKFEKATCVTIQIDSQKTFTHSLF